VIEEKALLDAVSSRRLFGAALDTFEKEPLSANDPLATEPNIVLSPHVAWMSEEAEVTLRRRASEELAAILAGRAPTSPVTAAG
jgi:D-3-phosphoglycerate dehydrogenase / 2-oxoglutarate reductase